MKIINVLTTDRLTIRNYEVSDKDFCTGMWYDNENGKYLSDPTEDYVDDVYQAAVDSMQDSEEGYYFVVVDTVNANRVGTCCAFPNEDNSGLDIGYCIHKKYWRNGYATEVVKKLIGWASQQSYKTITAEVAKDNEASCGLLKKLGFTIKEEKSFKKYHMDISYDSYVFEYRL